MKRFAHILLLKALLLTVGGLPELLAQGLPMACVGLTQRYGVRGFNGVSSFEWVITDPNGNVLPPTSYKLLARGDSIDITWGEGLMGGIYTLTVTEHSDYGCTGTPLSVDIVLNTPEIFLPISNDLNDSTGVCFGSIASLNPGSGFINYLWQDGNTNQVYYTGEAGTYRVRLVSDTHSCSYDSTRLVVWDLPTVNLGSDTVLFGNQALELNAYNPDIAFYSWSTGQISSDITVSGSQGEQRVWVLVTDINGCQNSDTINISAADYGNLFIPKAFTPNGDGFNDFWEFPAIKGPDGKYVLVTEFLNDINVKVFNRWGKLVWKSSGLYKPWNGKDLGGRELPMDSYHYYIVLTVGDKSYEYKGSITIIR